MFRSYQTIIKAHTSLKENIYICVHMCRKKGKTNLALRHEGDEAVAV
jgi:hypothetical protein